MNMISYTSCMKVLMISPIRKVENTQEIAFKNNEFI